MAIGIVRQIASGTHQQVTIPSGNYPWPTIRVLNPNDGVVYVKQNADITAIGYGSWDYKVPSQSFGLLPGEGQGWQSVGLYYLDQSGSGANGEISIYLTQQDATEPVFVSIGRAIVSQTTSMDVVQGSQPANPGAGISRIWSNTNGNLNILLPNGTNNIVYDASNIGTVTVGGDLYGTINAAHIGIQYNDHIDFHYSNNSFQRAFQPVNNDNYIFTGNSGRMYFWSDTPSVDLGYWDAPTNQLVTNGSILVGLNQTYSSLYFTNNTMWIENNGSGQFAYIAPGNMHYFLYANNTADLGQVAMGQLGVGRIPGDSMGSYMSIVSRIGPQIGLYDSGGNVGFGLGVNSGELTIFTPSYIGFRLNNNAGARNLYFDVGGGNSYVNTSYMNTIQCAGSGVVSGTLTVSGTLNVGTSAFISGTLTLQNAPGPAAAGSGLLYWHQNQTVYQYTSYPYNTFYNLGLSFSATPASAYAVITGNVGGAPGSMMAVAYGLYSSVEHAREYGIKNVKINDPLILVNSVTGYYYDHISFDDDDKPRHKEDGSLETTPMYGFSALEVSQNIPEVALDKGVDNGRMVAILWEAVKELDARTASLKSV